MKRSGWKFAATLVALMLALASTAGAQGGTIGGSTGGGGNAVVTDSLKRLANGSAAAPSLAFLNSSGTGLYRFGADTLGFATGGKRAVIVTSDSALVAFGSIRAPALSVFAYSFTGDGDTGIGTDAANRIQFVAGGAVPFRMSNTANIALQVLGIPDGTAASPGLYFNSDANVGLYRKGADTISVTTGGIARLHIASNAATGAGDVALCITTGDVLTKGATCGSSTRKIKTGIASLTPILATRALALRPVSFTYKPGFYGGARTYGLIAEEVARVDSTFAFYAEVDQKLANGEVIKKGEPYNVNDRAVLAALIATVQEQQRVIDSLRRNSPRSAASTAVAGPSTTELALLVGAGAAAAGLAARRRRRTA